MFNNDQKNIEIKKKKPARRPWRAANVAIFTAHNRTVKQPY
jgi:hypothetical protein